jgi:carbon storage regulator
MIGDQVEISVLAVMGDKVRLGIEAPPEVPIYRTEIYLEIQEHGSRREQRRQDAVDRELGRLSQGEAPEG